jgi:DNA-binding CsgD family transcriptional regulator
VAELLYVSPHTVRTHVKNTMRKLRARTRAQAVAIALRDGVLELD